jgi:glycosyltransferase involved in cell wall biosynthesis
MIYPKISIITPSFNQAKYIEKTVTSVLNQNYTNLEYIILDGGSTDGCVDIIKKYSEKIYYWESKPDKGQADAIFRGFEKSTGDIVAWINSDDYFLDNALLTVGKFFADNPETKWLIGNGIIIDESGKEILRCYSPRIDFNKILFYGGAFIQPSMFISRNAFFEAGGFDRTFNFSFDVDLFLNLAKNWPPRQIDEFLSAFRFHSQSKTSTLNDTRIRESNLIRFEKYKVYTKNRLEFRLIKTGNILSLVLHRFRTSGIKQYTKFLLKTYR